mgnify:CR=1 FL=1
MRQRAALLLLHADLFLRGLSGLPLVDHGKRIQAVLHRTLGGLGSG